LIQINESLHTNKQVYRVKLDNRGRPLFCRENWNLLHVTDRLDIIYVSNTPRCGRNGNCNLRDDEHTDCICYVLSIRVWIWDKQCKINFAPWHPGITHKNTWCDNEHSYTLKTMEDCVTHCVWFWFGLTQLSIYQIYRGVSFIGGRNRSTRGKPPTCRKSLINFII
jgi:hypothetical protein